jgi:hypothetical protein
MFSRARQAISRVFVPGLDLYPDGGVTIPNVTVDQNTTSAGQQAKFICDGYLVAVSASVQSGTAADLATTSLALVINGSTSVFQTGQQGTGFVTFDQIQKVGAAGSGARIMAPIRQSVPYQVFIQYVGGNATVVADVTLWYVNTSSPPITD